MGTADRWPTEAHAKATWLRPGLGEGRTDHAAESGTILSPKELRISGNQTYRLDMSEEQKEAAVLMASAVRVGSRLERTGESRLYVGRVGIEENIQETQCGLQEGSFLRSGVWVENSWKDRA